jgi:hypothetical protein
MRVRIHHRDRQSGSWTTTVVDTDHVPQIGQLLAPAPIHVFRVVLTLHVLFDAEYDAEVFAERVDFEELQTEELGSIVWQGG